MNMKFSGPALLTALLLAGGSLGESPYQGQQTRELKSLSAQEIDDLQNGRGMGFAKAAELNHYPGPMHVLELSGALQLSEEQRVRSEAIFAEMKADARALGARILELEEDVERRFSGGRADADALAPLLTQLGALYGQLRYVHLAAHVAQRSVLTPEQIRMYDDLRGYKEDNQAHDRHSHGESP